jgi:hypothetical protein
MVCLLISLVPLRREMIVTFYRRCTGSSSSRDIRAIAQCTGFIYITLLLAFAVGCTVWLWSPTVDYQPYVIVWHGEPTLIDGQLASSLVLRSDLVPDVFVCRMSLKTVLTPQELTDFYTIGSAVSAYRSVGAPFSPNWRCYLDDPTPFVDARFAAGFLKRVIWTAIGVATYFVLEIVGLKFLV